MFEAGGQSERGWRDFAANPELAVGLCLLAVLVGLSTLQVVMRYVFDAPLEWTQEVSGIVLVWMTFTTAVGLTRRNLHTRVEMLHEFTASGRLVRIVDTLLDVVSIAFLVYVTIGGWDLIQQMSYERTPALRLPSSVHLAAIPVTSALMALFLAVRVVTSLVRALRPRP